MEAADQAMNAPVLTAYQSRRHSGVPAARALGFTLIELMIVVVIITILATIAYPTYTRYTIRTSREAAQSQLMELANTQERIFLNSSAYSSSVTAAYTGQSGGGLGITSGKTNDNKYTLGVSGVTNTTFTLTATPVTTSTQKNDGTLTIDQSGKRGGTYGNW